MSTGENLSTAALLERIRDEEDLLEVGHAFRELVQLRDEADAAIAVGVAVMRQRLASWAEIAGALGVSKQAAQQRYGGAV